MAGEVQTRYEEFRSRALNSAEDLCVSAFQDALRNLWARLERCGILGLFDDDPSGEDWRQLSSQDAKAGLYGLELVAVERRDARERWSKAYEILRLKVESLNGSFSLCER